MIQVYTGNGKGKTTAAIGLSVRAVGAGLKVYIGQFVKSGCYNEIKALKRFRNIKIEQFGGNCFIRNRPSLKDRLLANEGLKRVKEIITMKIYDIVIMDEINIALKLKLIKLQDVTKLIKDVPCKTELILTGRCAHPLVLKLADLVSEIKEKKHYFHKGIKARKGIEY